MPETINPEDAQAIERMENAIKAYINPHPLDHDNEREDDFFTGIPGFLNERDEQENTRACPREENIELCRRIERHAGEWLQSSMAALWPLLKDRHFRSVELVVDLFRFILDGGSVARHRPRIPPLHPSCLLHLGEMVLQGDMGHDSVAAPGGRASWRLADSSITSPEFRACPFAPAMPTSSLLVFPSPPPRHGGR